MTIKSHSLGINDKEEEDVSVKIPRHAYDLAKQHAAECEPRSTIKYVVEAAILSYVAIRNSAACRHPDKVGVGGGAHVEKKTRRQIGNT